MIKRIVLIISVIFLFACVNDGEKAKEHMETAEELLYDENYDDALVELEKVLEMKVDQEKALTWKKQIEDYLSALEEFESGDFSQVKHLIEDFLDEGEGPDVLKEKALG